MNRQPLLIQDAFDFGPLPPKSREAPWEKLYRFFFGDDVFISYSRADAIRYAPGLAARLAGKRHICFFDQLAAAPSEDLPERLKKKILRSTVFVLVGTRGAVASSAVRKEVELFRRTRRPFIPVDVDGALVEQENWRDVIGVAKIREEGARVRGGDPSPEVVNLIKDSFRYTRRSQWLRASLLAGVSVILITAAASLLLTRTAEAKIRAAETEAAAIKRQAEAEVAAANIKVGAAQARLESIAAEAANARKQADKASAAAKAASTQRQAAERAMRQAQELEQQAAERAADTSRREAGSRAALLSRKPGMEADALSLAVEAAGQSVAHRGAMPDEVLNGITASAGASDYSLPLEDAGMLGVGLPLISPDGQKIVGGIILPLTNTTRLVLWDARTGRKTADFSAAGEVHTMAFSRDGRRLATIARVGEQQELSFWDLDGPEPRRLQSPCGLEYGAGNLALDSDGSQAAFDEWLPDTSPKLTVCQVATGRKERLPGMQSVSGAAFTPDDEPAIYGYFGPVPLPLPPQVLYFPRSGRQVTPKFYADPQGAKLAGFGDDGSLIIIVRDNTVPLGQGRVYVQSPGGDVHRFAGYRGAAASAAFVGGQAQVVIATGRGARVADARRSASFAALRAHMRPLEMIIASPDQRTALTVSDDGKGRLWDMQTWRLRHTLAISEEYLYEGGKSLHRSKSAAFRADGKRLVTANDKGEIQTWDVETGRPLCAVPGRSTEPNDYLNGLSFITGGDYLLAVYSGLGPTNSFINFLDARTCETVGTLKLSERVMFVLFSRDGTAMLTRAYSASELSATSNLASAWEPNELELWSLRGIAPGGAPLSLPDPVMVKVPGFLYGLSFDAARVLSASTDTTGQIWVSDGGSPVPLEKGPGDMTAISRFAFSADGTRAAGVSWKEASVWDTRTGKLLLTFDCDADASIPITLSPDGSRLLIAGRDSTVRVYPTSREDFVGVAKRLSGR